MRLAVVGSREWPEEERVGMYLTTLHDAEVIDLIVSGGARGVDRLAEAWARRNRVPVVSFRPLNVDPDSFRGWAIRRVSIGADGRETFYILPERYPGFAPAAFVRNGYIVEWADEVVAFWDGHSRGTRDSVAKARELGVLRDVLHPNRSEAAPTFGL